MADTYQFEELDAETRQYIGIVRAKNGKGMPGIYAGKSNYLPWVGIFLGSVVLIGTLVATFPPTEHPIKEAMLQTAGVLVGLWLILAAFRVWMAGASGRYAGHFVYVDPETLYEGRGSSVRVTDLIDLREANAVQNFNEGNYQNTSIKLKLGKDRETIEVNDEERGRRMTVFLNAVVYMRDGGEDGTDEKLKKLSPEVMGSVAKEVARTGQFPEHYSAEDVDAGRIPRPKKEHRASFGLFGILIWIGVGAATFVGCTTVNKPFRDEAIFARIKELPAKDRPPAWRMYLANPDFTAHRDEIERDLNAYYDSAVNTWVNGNDPQMKDALKELVLSLKTREPVISIITREEPGALGDDVGRDRENALRKKLADSLGSTIGDELVVFAAPTKGEGSQEVDKSLKGMIDVSWKFKDREIIEYTVEFRKGPDEEPYAKKTFALPLVNPNDANQFGETVGSQILAQTVGNVRGRQMIIQGGDF